MVEIINKYETIIVVDNSKGEEETAAVIDKFKSLIEQNGEIENVAEWGKRTLAYPINDLTEGYYVLIDFSAKPTFIYELERRYRISSEVLRTIVVKKES
ncbi:MAG: 30S ribosomal protein S6 [Oscillospiraceae bacterium]|nr:30S ribosomal protein S6 [Oscillospiraceae bacterium]